MTSKELRFGPYRLDVESQRLHLADEEISLSPKGFGVLHHLAARPGRLVTKQELLEAVWPGTHVTEGVLKRAVLEIRKALRDPVDEPKFIQTLHRRGYRFLSEGDPRAAGPEAGGRGGIVGRAREFLEFDAVFDAAMSGSRQIVFVSGEAGVGKTTLVSTWLATLQGDFAVATGRCAQQFGAGEPYLPVFEALEQLSQSLGARLAGLLRARAPTWLLQMPSLISPVERASLREEVLGSTRERMLREITDALEALTQESPLLLTLEDLHWSDPSTIDLVRSLAARTAPARLVVLATFRPGDAARSAPALLAVQNELEIHRKCKSLPLGHLTEADVGEYMNTRFRDRPGLRALTAPLYHRTNGNPLFIACLVDELERSGNLTPDESAIRELVPETLQQMFERQADQLASRERDMLDVAAAAGEWFSTAHIAEAMGVDPAETEAISESLARRNLMLKRWTPARFPDGSDSPGYAFVHALCRDALYRRIPAGRRAQLHGLLGSAQQMLYAGDLKRIAAELAGHFEMAGNLQAAIRYLRLASQGAAERYSNREAAQYLDRALELTERMRPAERAEIRLDVLEQRAALRMSASDMPGSIADYRTVAEEATSMGDADRAENALIQTLPTAILIDYRLSLQTVEEIRLSHAKPLPGGAARPANPELDNLIDLVSASVWMYLNGLTPELHQIAMRAGEALSGATIILRSRIGWMICLNYQYAADYANCCLKAEETRRDALAANIFFDYFISTLCLIWSLIHRGNLGYALRMTIEGEELATKNDNSLALGWFQTRRAWVLMEAFDYDGARPVCERMATDPLFANHRHGSPLFLWVGMARLGTGDYDGASEAFERLQDVAEARGIGFQYTLMLRQFQAECALRQGKPAAAALIANRLVHLASRHGERTYVSHGYRLLAEISMAENDFATALVHAEAAVSVLRGIESLPAEWRAHATVAKVLSALGQREESLSHQSISLRAAHQIADTLAAEPRLAQSLVSHVQKHLS